jgi:hypothetical protein
MPDEIAEEFRVLVRRAGLPVTEAQLADLLPTYADLKAQMALLDAHLDPHLEPATVFQLPPEAAR